MTADTAWLLIWIGFLAVSVTAAMALFFWGIRTRQFGDQERARSLALDAEIPEEAQAVTEEDNG